MEQEQWIVRELLDDDYGCEELPPDAEPMTAVHLTDPSGEERWVRLPYRLTRTWHTGDRVCLSNPKESPKEE